MMKYIILFIIFFSGIIFGQVNESAKLNTVYKLPPAPTTKINTLTTNPNEIYTDVDESADFVNGGFRNFKTQIKNNFQIDKMHETGKFETSVHFIIEKDGTISDIKASGKNESFNKETVRAILRIKDKWNPGKIKGQKVRSHFGLPFTMNFE